MDGQNEIKDFEQFEDDWLRQHRSSIPTHRIALEYPPLLTWAVLAMFLCAALLSGVHTAPTAYQTIEASKVSELVRQAAALATFGFVELGILVSSYLLFKRSSNEWFALGVLIICSFIAMAANLYSVSKALQADDFGSVVVGVSIGIGAPLIAALTGKVFVNLHQSNANAERRANDLYEQAMQKLEEDVRSDFQQYLSDEEERQRERAEQLRIDMEREHKRLVAEQRKQLPANTDKTPAKTGKKNTVPDKDQIMDYLRLPENEQKSIRVAAMELGVSPTMVHTLRKQLSEQPKTGGGDL